MPYGDVIVGHLGEVLDVDENAAHQVAFELVNMGNNLQVPVRLGVALSPTVDALVGVYLYEAQILPGPWMGEESGHAGDFHRWPP